MRSDISEDILRYGRNEVITPFVNKMIGLGIEDIKNTENVICVAGLEMKAEAILEL